MDKPASKKFSWQQKINQWIGAEPAISGFDGGNVHGFNEEAAAEDRSWIRMRLSLDPDSPALLFADLDQIVGLIANRLDFAARASPSTIAAVNIGPMASVAMPSA